LGRVQDKKKNFREKEQKDSGKRNTADRKPERNQEATRLNEKNFVERGEADCWV